MERPIDAFDIELPGDGCRAYAERIRNAVIAIYE